MSSSTALLPKPNKKDEHSIFLRVCHSPWINISQRILVAIRGSVAVYMSYVFVVLIYFGFLRNEHKWLVPFEFANITYLLQVIYAWAAFEIFSIFYTAVVVFPYVAALVYWLILIPNEQTTPMDLLGHDWFDTFCILNKYGINTTIAFIEVSVLSSIKRQDPVWIHLGGLSILCGVYIGWVFVGRLATGHYAYFFFDFQENGWEYALVTVGSFIGLTNIFFAVNYGITGLREMLTSEAKDVSIGYTRLPQ